MSEFTIKDSGERSCFGGGMVRDASEGKIDYTSIFFGPMLKRWASHLTKGRKKYPDPAPGVPNWTLAEGVPELLHAKQSLLRHVVAYMEGEKDEDHAAAIFFNINLMEYLRDKQLDKFHASLQHLPPVTSDDNPDAEAPGIEAPGLHNGGDCASSSPLREWEDGDS